jgi:hypothetical protein
MDNALLHAFTQALADRYAIERELGRGGMATVFLARDIKHDRRVAIKVLEPELGAVLGHERFQAEIKVTATLQHPNLLPLFDSGEAAGQLFYVMPYVQGETLRARLERERQLPVDEALRMVTAIAGALDYAHAHGVIHRDLKPENILLQAGQPVVADFGIALAVSNAGGARVTQTGLSLGTPQYMSPEQATGERQIDARSDQFSLAAVAYELLVGEPPHTGGTAQIILARLMTEVPRPVHATRASVPAHVSAAIARALSKAPADRFASTHAFADALAAPARNAGTVRGTRVFRAALIAGTVALFIGGAWLWRGRLGAAPMDGAAVLIAPTGTGGSADLTTVAASVDDAITQQLAMLAWPKARTAANTPATDAAAAAAARKLGAPTVAIASLLPTADGPQLRLRLIDAASGAIVRQLPTIALGHSPSPDELRRAVEPLVVGIGYLTSPHLGVVTLPAGPLPTLETFRVVVDAIASFSTDVPTADARVRTVETLRRAVNTDSTFLQAKLWLGFLYGWGSYISRFPGGPERADTVDRWVEESRRRGSPYEVALAEVAKSTYNEIGDAGLESIRRLLALHPTSPLQRVFPSMLLELNRPHEALRQYYAIGSRLPVGDSADMPRQAAFWSGVSDAWHYVGRYDSSLVVIRRARDMRRGDMTLLTLELQALAALGQMDALRTTLGEVGSAAGNGALFGFAGNAYLTVANELLAHGHPAEAREVATKGLRWFEQNNQEVTRVVHFAVRKALVLMMLDRRADAEHEMRAAIAIDTSDVRPHGMLGRLYAMQGRTAAMNAELAWLAARPAERLQGAPTYERAAITVHLGRDHWDEALSLLELSLRQGQGYGIRRRLHFFQDWLPLRDYPPFKRIVTPNG